jgi:hypothetical protein
MQKSIPKFAFHLSNPCSEKYRGIEVNGEIVHWIEDTEKFAGMFGFTHDMRMAGISPDQFIQNEYINNREFDFTACIQAQIIEYLRVHSKKFIEQHGKQCEKWLTQLARLRAARDEICRTCKIKPFCSH